MDYTKNIFEKRGHWVKITTSVDSVFTDINGQFWGATEELYFFDHNYNRYSVHEIKELGPFINADFSKDNRFWVLTESGKLLSYDLISKSLTDHTDFLPDLTEAYWLWTSKLSDEILIGLPFKLIRFDKKDYTVLDVPGDELKRLNHATISPKGEVWYTCSSGVYCCSGEKQTNLGLNKNAIKSVLWEVIVTRDNVAWVASQDAGIFTIDGDTGDVENVDSGLAQYTPGMPLLEDHAGNVWVRYRSHSIACITKYGRVYFTSEDGTPTQFVRYAHQDSQGKIWFCCGAEGVWIYDASRLVKISSRSVFSTCESGDGGYFMGTPTKGILKYKDDQIKVFNRNLLCGHRTRLHSVPPNQLLVHASASHITTRIDTDIGRKSVLKKPFNEGCRHLLSAGNGVVWLITTERKLYRVDGERVQCFSADEVGFELDPGQLHLFKDRKQNLLIFNDKKNTALIYDGVKFNSLDFTLSPEVFPVQNFFEDSKSRIWIVNKKSDIFCITGKVIKKVRKDPQFDSFKVFSIMEINSGVILFGTSLGLLEYDGNTWQSLSSSNLLPQTEVMGLNRLNKGDILISTLMGVYRYCPDYKNTPKVLIAKVEADKTYEWPSNLKIHRGINSFTINFFGITAKLGNLKFIYRLKGYEKDWIETWSSSVKYQNLPLGDYLFELRCLDVDMLYSDQDAILPIRIIENPEKEQIDKLELELRETKDFYENIVRSIKEAIFIIDPDGAIKMANNAAINLLEHSGNDIKDKNILDFLDEGDSSIFTKKGSELLIEQGVLKNKECQMLTMEGKKVHVLMSGSSICNRDGYFEGIVLIATDMTAYHELQQQLNHKQKMESLGVVAGGIAHDFNNLLGVIIGNTDLIRMNLPADSDSVKYASDVIAASERAAKLCSSLLDYTGKSFVVKKRLDISSQVQGMVDLLRASISSKIELTCCLEEKLPPICAGESQIDQIVLNLITNASEAIGDNYGTVSLTTRFENVDAKDLLSPYMKDMSTSSGLYVIIEVKDSGCGMDKETEKRICDPFFTSKFTGRGLGLAAVHGIIHTLKGSLKVKSSPGKGSTFTVLIPAFEDDVKDEKRVEMPSGESNLRGKGTALFVDDDSSFTTMAKHMLEHIGFSVITAIDGGEAVHKFKELHDQLSFVLMDNTMPRMDGKEALKHMREITSDVPIIISSGVSEINLKEELQKHHKVYFLHKPYNLDELLQTLQEADVIS